MIGVLDRKLLRQIRSNWGPALAVCAVIACGMASYITLATAHRNLLLTRNAYYRENHFADFEIRLERAPVTALIDLAELKGVRRVRGRIVEDVNLDIAGVTDPRVGRIVSMPTRSRDVLNGIAIQKGTYFEPGAVDTVILSKRFAEANALGLGDRIEVVLGEKKHTLRIIALAQSPEYVYMIPSVQELAPSPERFGVLWAPREFVETALGMEEACNNVIGAVFDPAGLDRILHEAETVMDPYGVYAKNRREDQISHRMLADEIKGLEVSARIMPAIFLGIAAVILLVVLNRMVRNERTQIGLMKAYGRSTWSVAFHYVKYALILSVVGCLGGFLLGQLLARGMMSVYVQFYSFPLLRSRAYPDVMARAMLVAVAAAVLGALAAAVRAARIRPAEAMRPAPPSYGHTAALQKLGEAWRRLSFTWKMVFRNMVRNPFRVAFMVFGVTASTGLLVVGGFTADAMDYLIRYQFDEVQREDVTVHLAREYGKDALYDLARLEYVREAEPMLQYPFEMRHGWRKKDIAIVGLPRNADLRHLAGVDGAPVDLGEEGLVLSEKLADALGATVGDVIDLEPLMGRIEGVRRAPVTQIVQQYLGMSAYMNIEALSRLLEESLALNAALLRTERGRADDVNEGLKDVAGVASVEIKSNTLDNINKSIGEFMGITTAITVFFAGVIAFSIIYNVTSVSLAERERELASLRVLGFTTQEVGRVLYYENFCLAGLGVFLGLPLGYALTAAIVDAYNTEIYRLPLYVEPMSYVAAAFYSLVFVVLSNLAVRRRVARLDIIDVLKSRE